jgi:ubiquinone/menaquinone biosynthesis C-methylase UbiE
MAGGFFKNFRKPQGWMGRFVAKSMNVGHSTISKWGLSCLGPKECSSVLDIGCGGGANVECLLRMYPSSQVDGIDYSEESVAISRRKNARALGKRCAIKLGTVSALPYGDEAFDIVTAFETVYFWPDIEGDINEVRRVLRCGGTFLICNDACDPNDETWSSRIDGMRIYSQNELADLLSRQGFSGIACTVHAKHGWLCVTAVKG